MERLPTFCKKSKFLSFSQLITLQQLCKEHAIDMTFIHKYLVKFRFQHEKAYLKINPYDGEFFFISKTHSLRMFESFHDFKAWFLAHYTVKVDDKDG